MARPSSEVDPTIFDAWKRRAQVQMARGEAYLRTALDDINQAEKLSQGRDPDIYHQRGVVWHKLKDFRRALVDFERHVKAEPKEAVGWNYVGLCAAQLGDGENAIKAYEK